MGFRKPVPSSVSSSHRHKDEPNSSPWWHQSCFFCPVPVLLFHMWLQMLIFPPLLLSAHVDSCLVAVTQTNCKPHCWLTFFNQVPNYYKIIKQPMDLKKVKRRLQLRSSQYYQSTQEFVSDMRLVFKNCAKYNEVSSMSLEPALGFGEWPLLVCVHSKG